MSAAANWVAAGHTAPILYLPMDDPATAHINLGTGGDMTLNGTIARSGRGPNQFNVPYSDLDGAADYLSKASAPTGIADGKQLTFCCAFSTDDVSSGSTRRLLSASDGGNETVSIRAGYSGQIQIRCESSGGFQVQGTSASSVIAANRSYALAISFDTTDTGKRHVYLNGQSLSLTWSTYDPATNIDFTVSYWAVGDNAVSATTGLHNGRLGNVFFHTSYIDLSVPANLAKFVTGTGIDAKPVDLGANGELPFGTPPLIYLPMYGNNAGKNYGSGGDFTVNSGPYTGARGPNEYWGNWADFDGSAYMYKNSAVSALTSASAASISFAANPTNFTGQRQILGLFTSGGSAVVQIVLENSTGNIILEVPNTGGSVFKKSDTALTAGATNYIQISVNTSTGTVYGYKNGVSFTWSSVGGQGTGTYNPSTATKNRIGVDAFGTSLMLGGISELYFTTDYIDFSQEANRLLFRDCFGNPTDLPAHIEAGTVPTPDIYMRFDPADKGRNDGTGGNFTPSGTINDAGQL